jgi:hypothetical protein
MIRLERIAVRYIQMPAWEQEWQPSQQSEDGGGVQEPREE